MMNVTPGKRLVGFGLSLLVLILCFSRILYDLVHFAVQSDLESHIILIPFISAFFLYLSWKEKGIAPGFSLLPAVFIMAGAVALLGVQIGLIRGDSGYGDAARLFFPVAACVVFVIGLYVLFFSFESFRRALFPLLFLFVMLPIPESVAQWMKMGLQAWSADMAHGMLFLTGTPVLREGMFFSLPGITFEVAEECSGIHSSLVLLIISVVAGHLFLKRPWSKALLVAAVLPLGIIRNGFRIVTITLLTIHVDPDIINSPLHHRGGPIFFALSMIVFLGVLWALRRHERKREAPARGAQ